LTKVSVDVPAGTFLPDGSLASGAVGIYARFRLFDTASDPGIDAIGLAVNGEVEDYFWSFSPTAVTMRGSRATATDTQIRVILFVTALLVTTASVVIVRRKDML
jgi:hypothetical protein